MYNTPQELKNHLAENGISADMLAFVGLDPGKHNIISAALVEEFVQKQLAKTPLLQRKAHSVSYTQGQREKETGALRMKKTLRSLCPREVRDAEKMLTVQEDGKLGVPNGRSMNVERYTNYLAERAKGMRCRSHFYGDIKWWNDHIAVPLTPKEKERAEKSEDQHVRRKTP